MNRDLGDERREYGREKMEISNLPADPMDLFSQWLHQAVQSDTIDPSAMTLSTVNSKGQPSSRIVLLKKVEEGSLVFYTHYDSEKSREIKANNKLAAHFYWPELERQVRITGTATPLSEKDSNLYFRSRPLESKIAAWASPQSKEIPNRETLEKAFEKYSRKFSDTDDIPRPAFWGGYAIDPSRIEFWQGGLRRLHDRIAYSKEGENWVRQRLAP